MPAAVLHYMQCGESAGYSLNNIHAKTYYNKHFYPAIITHPIKVIQITCL